MFCLELGEVFLREDLGSKAAAEEAYRKALDTYDHAQEYNPTEFLGYSDRKWSHDGKYFNHFDSL